jgi:Mg2+ and Co2+ transporter CorA
MVEASLGVSQNVGMLRNSGYPEVSWDFDALIAKVATLSKRAAESELAVSTTLALAKALQNTVEVCEDLEGRQGWSEQRQEIQSTITRAEITLHSLKMSQAVLDSLSTTLYNHIAKTDTGSMKTIAVVTLLFLPATFVSAIFSTGIFDFHANESDSEKRVRSSYGWIYLLACILTTGIALVAWVLWYKWGSVWLYKLRRPNRTQQ